MVHNKSPWEQHKNSSTNHNFTNKIEGGTKNRSTSQTTQAKNAAKKGGGDGYCCRKRWERKTKVREQVLTTNSDDDESRTSSSNAADAATKSLARRCSELACSSSRWNCRSWLSLSATSLSPLDSVGINEILSPSHNIRRALISRFNL